MQGHGLSMAVSVKAWAETNGLRERMPVAVAYGSSDKLIAKAKCSVLKILPTVG
jgi:hypothetical protein